MFELHFGQVLQHALPVLGELAHVAGHVEEGIHTVAQSEVVGLRQNFNAVREGSLTTDCFLESGTCSPAAVDLSVEKTDVNQFACESHHVGPHNFWGICPSETPNHVARCISHVGSHAVVAQVNVVYKRFF